MIRSRGGCSWSWPAAWDWLLELGGRVGLVPGAGRLRGICPWSWSAAWESPLGGVAIVSGIPPPSVGLASGAGRPWNLPLEGVGLTSGVVRPWESPLGGVGFASFAGRRQQQRRIPRSRKTDTPSDLRFLKSPLWDLPLELFFRGNRPWSPSGKKNRRSSRTVDASAGRPVPSDPPPRADPSQATPRRGPPRPKRPRRITPPTAASRSRVQSTRPNLLQAVAMCPISFHIHNALERLQLPSAIEPNKRLVLIPIFLLEIYFGRSWVREPRSPLW